ncbi:SpvB/TcaC N-terminal domain-containing protein [Pantanalinema rosaneae CENA516]|uniref:SpvB/TcaC N-terminal domain-containing protein n=1 Tax=Pantanalinema rosaneae TaxID=1620701 RepID=UPI003D6ED1A1
MPTLSDSPDGSQVSDSSKSYYSPPVAVSLPKGGGAIKGMGEKFAANPVTGTGSMTVPIAASPGRSGFAPQLSLSYDSGAGNGPFGFGWNLSLPSITRKTDKGLPRYEDATESDVFILSGAEDLVPVLVKNAQGEWILESPINRTVGDKTYVIKRYRPRIEGLFARIECWTNVADPNDVHWCSFSKDNILTLYGKDQNSRIFDPANPRRIFSWLICETRDDKGNAILYHYKAEDGAGVDLSLAHERNRGDRNATQRTANRYLKNIRYGNRIPLLDSTGQRPHFLTQAAIDNAGWMFEVVFDYGEHHATVPTPKDSGDWDYRNDPFSTYRAGFEVRTTRLCQRVLMFHHFPDEPGVGQNCLVRSTDFTYSHENQPTPVQNPIYSKLIAVTQTGYKRKPEGDYLPKSLPSLEFTYSEPEIDPTVREVDRGSLENLPIGLDGSAYQWTDLHGEGIPGILTEQAGSWFYKRNLSPISQQPVEFAPVELVISKPNLSVSGGQAQFMDLAGDGQPDLVVMDGSMPGLYEHDGQEGWQPFRPFTSRLNRDMGDPNLKFVDLDGDGHADVLITEQDALVWHPSLAEEGFGAAQRVAQALDEEKGPRLVFADGSQSIYLADLSGDGLTDLVRIRNGEVCYWPNLGYGQFGAKVTMDNAPHFDYPDQFDQKRIRLADIDGSGTTDIIYLHQDGVQLYFNQSGNGWSAAQLLQSFPPVDSLASIMAVDLRGNGTACLVWSSPLPGDVGQQMRYVSLMGEQKPHLLIQTRNNLGAETIVQYAPSTKFYLRDKRDGKPWITRLPFPVHVVERVETYDQISGNRFVTRYAYHHGYFDGEEREFCGFGMVEQWDTEAYAELAKGNLFAAGTNDEESFHVPPVQTKTWFHTGAFIDREHLSTYFAETEYYREHRHRVPEEATEAERKRIEAEFKAMLLPDTVLPDGLTTTVTERLPDGTEETRTIRLPHPLTVQEEREACRALKGSILRQEVYALDRTGEAEHPYTVAESNYEIRQLQPRQDGQYGVFFVHPQESLTYHYERHPEDPRVAHQMTLEVDGFGNVRKSVEIAYPRRIPAYPEQAKTLATYTENWVTNKANVSNWYRIGVPIETCTYEITGIEAPQSSTFVPLTLDFIRSHLAAAVEIPYEAFASAGVQKRLIERVRSRYRANQTAKTTDPKPLPLGDVDSLALPCESFKLAFTPELLAQVYGATNGNKIGLSDLQALLRKEGKYIEQDGLWWIPSGRQAFDSDAFYLPIQTKDPFGGLYTVTYDDFHLLAIQTTDPIGNQIQIANDYRVLQPRQVTDPNGNRSQVVFDALGMVVGTAVMGKETESLGDSFERFNADLTSDEIAAFFATDDPRSQAIQHLGTATTRFIYDLEHLPASAAAIARTKHHSDLQEQSLELHEIQVSFVYSDGFGREVQTKIQAESGDAPLRDANGQLIWENGRLKLGHVDPRWVGTGSKVYNNKGKPVKQFEPFFSSTHHYEMESDLVEWGVTSILFYDPLDRVVATLHPNCTYEKVVFDAWQQATWDVNDTVMHNPSTDEDIKGFFIDDKGKERLPRHTYLPIWYQQRIDGALGTAEKRAAEKAANHADTPAIAHLDTLGRPFLTIADNGDDQKYPTHIDLDIEGNQWVITDARNNPVMIYGIPQRDSQGKPVKDTQGKPVLIGRAFDLLSHNLYSYSGDAGERWTLTNVAGKPIRTWNSRGFTVSMTYDALQRPTQLFVRSANQSGILAECTVYGERHPQAAQRNLKGKVYQVYDAAGVVTNQQYDFKGNLQDSQRQLSRTYRKTMDWMGISFHLYSAYSDRPLDLETIKRKLVPLLESEVFTSNTTYDALNRPIRMTTPDRSEIRPIYNEANLLERLEANLRGEETVTHFVSNIDYNEKGQRVLIEYGDRDADGKPTVAQTEYHYDLKTFRLTQLKTTRKTNPKVLQDLQYTYDPVGNITTIHDAAQQEIYFRNQVVKACADYTYDPIYRLITATGREHLGQKPDGSREPISIGHDDSLRMNRPHPHDGQAMGRYLQSYVYDMVGNILEMAHQGTDPKHPGWKRCYQYAVDSNRLLSTGYASDLRMPCPTPYAPDPMYGEIYTYDAHGSMTQMPHLKVMEWDFKDQLQATQQQVVNNGAGEKTYYVYDAAGQRVRKVTELPAADGATPRRKHERIYLGGFEIYREYNGNDITVTLERETLHIIDDEQRVALVEIKTIEVKDSIVNRITSPKALIRYQLNNHLGSTCIELDEKGNVIFYEEYYPYGSVSYQSKNSDIEVSLKRYRYTSKERDEETGLNYHEARYYALWLGRWISTDPEEMLDGLNLYTYVLNMPVKKTDLSGRATDEERQIQQVHIDEKHPVAKGGSSEDAANKSIIYGDVNKHKGTSKNRKKDVSF